MSETTLRFIWAAVPDGLFDASEAVVSPFALTSSWARLRRSVRTGQQLLGLPGSKHEESQMQIPSLPSPPQWPAHVGGDVLRQMEG